mmetsp:Transcript_56896/g.101535  ORF Transcript_56896/g.101535 Transcript_56896/m.101535 type:complete len:216 (+) Transcript_56896:1067-1714(+)
MPAGDSVLLNWAKRTVFFCPGWLAVVLGGATQVRTRGIGTAGTLARAAGRGLGPGAARGDRSGPLRMRRSEPVVRFWTRVIWDSSLRGVRMVAHSASASMTLRSTDLSFIAPASSSSSSSLDTSTSPCVSGHEPIEPPESREPAEPSESVRPESAKSSSVSSAVSSVALDRMDTSSGRISLLTTLDTGLHGLSRSTTGRRSPEPSSNLLGAWRGH